MGAKGNTTSAAKLGLCVSLSDICCIKCNICCMTV